MQRTLVAPALATVLLTTLVTTAHTAMPSNPVADTTAPKIGSGQPAGHDGTLPKPVTLDAIEVTAAALDLARNALSPDTGSSQYIINQRAIEQLPLGASTPLNQVLLQAPGVVQDSFGQLHVRGDRANLQYRINGVTLPASISGFGQTLDARTLESVKRLDGALPAQYGERTAAIVDITTRNGYQLDTGGNIGITGGSFGSLNPHASWWGRAGRWSWFLTGNHLADNVGIQNPTPSRKPLHDRTNQLKACGDLTYLAGRDTRLRFMFGVANNRFEIPNNPGQQSGFDYLDQTTFDSATSTSASTKTPASGPCHCRASLRRRPIRRRSDSASARSSSCRMRSAT